MKILSLELSVIGDLITSRAASVAQLVEHLPRKQYICRGFESHYSNCFFINKKDDPVCIALLTI